MSPAPADSLTLPAYAKVNLTLRVLGRRPDGYHDIRSLMQTVALHDTLTVTRRPDAPGVTLDVVGAEAEGVPSDSSNLVHRAAVRLQKTAAARGAVPGGHSGLHVVLEKRIPSQAGLGGGSSDAAAMLRAGDRLLGLGLSPRRLTELGAALGADVPFFLTGGTAWVEGLGEQVTPLPPLAPPWPLVIVKPPVGVSTAWAYAALDALPERPGGQAASESPSRLANDFENDFEQVVLRAVPEVAAAHEALRRLSPDFPPLLCGSGAAVFCRARDGDAAQAIAKRLRAERVGRVWVTETVEGGATWR